MKKTLHDVFTLQLFQELKVTVMMSYLSLKREMLANQQFQVKLLLQLD